MPIILSTRLAFCAFALLLWSINLVGQNSVQTGLLPAINFNKKLSRGYKLNLKVETRQGLFEGSFGEPLSFQHDNVLTDFTLIGAKQVDINKTATVGYLFRLRGGQIVHRSIQQLIIRDKVRGLRMAHRIATDQTFTPDQPVAYRLRYRIATEFALSGDEVDRREYYLKVNHEYLNEWEDGQYDLEVRLVPVLGLALNQYQKVEVGLDFRMNSFLDSAPQYRFWGVLNYFWSIR